jgi:two-component system cell cycle response regulator CpdR
MLRASCIRTPALSRSAQLIAVAVANRENSTKDCFGPEQAGTMAIGKRILLAEDDNDMRQFLTRALKNAGYEVVSFDNGKSAYDRLREEPFSLLLSDIVMPEMDGIELARRATELDPDLKVMFITGFAAVALNPDSEAPKEASVLSKPFHLRDLVNEVERLLAA